MNTCGYEENVKTRKVDKDNKREKDSVKNYICWYERGGEYKTNEMNEYRNNYSNNDCRI